MTEGVLMHWDDIPNDYKKHIKSYFRIDYVTLLIIGVFVCTAYIGVASGSTQLINKNTNEIIYNNLAFVSLVSLMAPVFIAVSVSKFMWLRLNSNTIQVRLETVTEVHNTRREVNGNYYTYTEKVDTHYSKGIKHLLRSNSYDIIEKSNTVIVIYLEDKAKYALLDK